MLVLHGRVAGSHDCVDVQIDGDRISAVGPAGEMAGECIDATGATLLPGRIDSALDLELPDDPGAAALAAIEALRGLRRDGLAGARVHGPEPVLTPLVAALDRLLLPRLRLAGLTLRFGAGVATVLGRPDGPKRLAADDPLVLLLAKAPALEAIEGDPPPGFDPCGVPLLRDVVDLAAFCGFDDVGRIAPGCRADLAAVEPDGRLRFRIVAGRVLA
jgi:hypothetical protein